MSPPAHSARTRARDLGIRIGHLDPGPHNAITDVPGVRVGQVTLIQGTGPLVVGQGPVRTGVTIVVPRPGDVGAEPCFAGYHVLNGNGEMTGLPWLDEVGLLTTPLAITNTHSVGVVRDALIAYSVRQGYLAQEAAWSLPVVAETYDGFLNDINGFHVKPEHVFAALDHAVSGPVAEGGVGGGTGMIAHGFKGGIGTSSRLVSYPTAVPPPGAHRDARAGGEGVTCTVGVLVQANYGSRARFTVDGVPAGREMPPDVVPMPGVPETAGSIIVVVATDAPLLPGQCRRLAQRATIGVGRMGGLGENSSGDIFLAFATGNRGLGEGRADWQPKAVQMLPNGALSPLFAAVADATEEAILNALCMAETMTGRDGHVAHALPLDRLQEVMRRYGRL